ncbi:MAG: aspartyl protease family protein [Acidobacteriota bacterium]
MSKSVWKHALKFAAVSAVPLFVALLVLGSPSPQSGPQKSKDQSIEQLMDSNQYDLALQKVREELKRNPGNLDYKSLEIRAMMGLRQDLPAAREALKLAAQHPERPEFRFLAGLCAFHLGYYSQAVNTWSRLYSTKGWAATALHYSVLAYTATGKTKEARDLLEKSLPKFKPVPTTLADDWAGLEPKASEVLRVLDAAKGDNSEDQAYLDNLKKLYQAVGKGSICELASMPSKPVTIKLKERSERLDTPGMAWGSTADMHTTTSVVIPVSIDGNKEDWLALDSGSDEVFLPEGLADDLHLQTVSSAIFQGLGEKGQIETRKVLIKSLKVGAVTFRNVPAKLIPKNADFWNKRGIIPLSLFKDFAILYDRRHGELGLYPSGTKPEAAWGEGTQPLKSLWLYGMPFVEVTVNQHKGAYLRVDTGGYASFFSSRHTGELGINVNTGKFSASHGVGLSGSFSAGVAENVPIVLGRSAINMRTTQVMDMGGDTPLFDQFGILGRDVLDLFEIFFDYHHNVVALKSYEKH